MSDLFPDARLGDEVCMKIRNGWSYDRFTLRTDKIEKVTQTQIVAFGRKWRRSDGLEVGSADKWRRAGIMPVTPEILAEWQAMKAMIRAEKDCARVGEILRRAKGADAIRLAAMMPEELKGGTR